MTLYLIVGLLSFMTGAAFGISVVAISAANEVQDA